MGSKGDAHYAEPSRGSIEVCVSNMHRGNKSCWVSVWSTVLLCKIWKSQRRINNEYTAISAMGKPPLHRNKNTGKYRLHGLQSSIFILKNAKLSGYYICKGLTCRPPPPQFYRHNSIIIIFISFLKTHFKH